MAPAPRALSKREVFAMARREREDPIPFYEYLASRAVADLQFPLLGARVLDLGCGPGHYTRALRSAGARVIPVDLDLDEFALPGGPPGDQLLADGARLPLRSAALDGVLCSNMLEHTPDVWAVFDEIVRVLRPGGWAWVSWTNWYSPWGGHEITPFHYLGPRLGPKVYEWLRGRPEKNVPGVGLFAVHIGEVLRHLKERSDLQVQSIVPRYYPSQRWLMKVPGLREVASWNCLIQFRRA